MLAVGLLVGGASIGAYQVFAQVTNDTETSTIHQVEQEEQNPEYQGSIALNDALYDGKNEKEESVVLAGLATITAEQAQQAAEDRLGSQATKVELGNENGSLVYEVQIANQEVKVDAGNGVILQIELDNDESEMDEGVEGKDENELDENDGIDHQFEGEEEHQD